MGKIFRLKHTAMIVIMLFFVVLGACGGDDNTDVVCLGPDETVSIKDKVSYGHMVKYNAGFDGAAWAQVDHCGWIIYNNHRGGVGGTLQIINGGTRLIWAYNKFQGIVLTEGWGGITKRGIGIGSTLHEFLSAYPEAIKEVLSYPDERLYTFKNTATYIIFDNDAQLWGIRDGYGSFYNLPGYDQLIDPDYINLEMFGEDIPGTWQDCLDIPGFTKAYLLEPPFRYDYNYEIKKGDRLRINIEVVSKGLSPICMETVQIEDYKELNRTEVECADNYLFYEAVIGTYYNVYEEEWRFNKLAILLSSDLCATGDYELSIKCPNGVDIGNSWDRTFCDIE